MKRLNEMDPEKAITSSQAARLVKVNPKSVQNWVKNGYIRAYRTPGGHYRFLVKDLIDFAVKHDIQVAHKQDPMTKLVTTYQAANLLQVSPSGVIKWVKQGMLATAGRTPGKHRRIRAEHLIEFAEKHNMPLPPLEDWSVVTSVG